MPVRDPWPVDADRDAVMAHRRHHLHEALLDHAIWSRLLAQRGVDGAYETVWIDQAGQPQVAIIDHAFLARHRRYLHTLRGDLIAAGADAPVSLEGIFASQRRVGPVAVATLLMNAMETVATAQQVLIHAAQTTKHAQRVCAQAATLVMPRRDDPGLGSIGGEAGQGR
jgi:hypothetical protein